MVILNFMKGGSASNNCSRTLLHGLHGLVRIKCLTDERQAQTIPKVLWLLNIGKN